MEWRGFTGFFSFPHIGTSGLFVNAVTKFQVPYICCNYLSSWVAVGFSKVTLLRGVFFSLFLMDDSVCSVTDFKVAGRTQLLRRTRIYFVGCISGLKYLTVYCKSYDLHALVILRFHVDVLPSDICISVCHIQVA
jgi:hypothetical protein